MRNHCIAWQHLHIKLKVWDKLKDHKIMAVWKPKGCTSAEAAQQKNKMKFKNSCITNYGLYINIYKAV